MSPFAFSKPFQCCKFICRYDGQLPPETVLLGSISGGIALGTPFSAYLSPTWALLIGVLAGILVALWIKVMNPITSKYAPSIALFPPRAAPATTC